MEKAQFPPRVTVTSEFVQRMNELDTSALDHMAGKILTVIDAVIADESQNKSVKDLIRNAMREPREWISRNKSDAGEVIAKAIGDTAYLEDWMPKGEYPRTWFPPLTKVS